MRGIALTALTALLVIACSGAAPATHTPSGTPIIFNGSPLPQYQAPSSGLLADIKNRGVLLNGVNAANPPFESVDTNGVIVGYDIDLSQDYANSLGVQLSTVDTAWDGVIPSLYAKKFDMIWSAMTVTAARQAAVNFSSPYMADQAVWITRADNNSINALQDLNGKTLCTQAGSAFEAQANQIISQNNLTTKVMSFPDFPTAYLALKNGQCDAATSSKLNDIPLYANNPSTYRDAIEMPSANYVGVATRLQDTDLAQSIQSFIQKAESDGTINALEQKWFGFTATLPASFTPSQ